MSFKVLADCANRVCCDVCCSAQTSMDSSSVTKRYLILDHLGGLCMRNDLAAFVGVTDVLVCLKS